MEFTALHMTSLLVYCIIVTFTPGPTNIVILSGVCNFGTKKTLEYVYGATIAFVILLTGSVMLSSMFMMAIPKILLAMQAIGCVYMLYLAYQIYNAGEANLDADQAVTFKGGFLMQLVNPKVILFTMTVIPSFVMPYDTSTVGLSIAVAVVTIIASLAMMTWVLFGTIFKEFLQEYQKPVSLVMSVFLVYSAIMISGVFDIFKG